MNTDPTGGSDKEVHLAEEALQELEWCLDQVLLDTDLGLPVTNPDEFLQIVILNVIFTPSWRGWK